MRILKTIFCTTAFLTLATSIQAQVLDSIPDPEVEPPMEELQPSDVALNTTPQAGPRRKLDGIAAVVGDYVILDSDIEKTLYDLRLQGATEEDVDNCSLLGKLMEDRLYAHQAVQDSILVSDDEVYAQSDRYLQQFEQRLGSMEKVLEFYKKATVEDLREELYEINKLQMLSQRMQQEVVGEIEVTPEEVRQFFRDIPEDERPVFGAELEIAQIVKKPEVPEEEKQKVIDRLRRIKQDVEDNGASFRVKAILNTDDEGSKSNGGFYSINRQTSFVKEFKDVAFSLREGEISEPFETIFGYHIIYIERVRGQELDLRHILIRPEIPKEALEAAKVELDSIRQQILDGRYTFAEAAKNFSDEKETKNEGGQLRNPENFDSKFELTKMDPTLYNQVRNLKDNEISYPIFEDDPRGGPPSYKILMVTNRYDEHPADFARDYLKIQELALRNKQFEAIRDWISEHIEDTYISVSAANQSCDFSNNWLKQ
ncbi:periplasmic chaperone for outer membrane proteins SurA [Robiginitalea myxolifaciens]|uniref:Periplasmic chaperone for outer membrane proteins SurA n=1 Tax=Robiginitalea myxolifaciens TaxID=400055 RepID=A0A1I6H6G1_9FLAO|nr:peptidylprolyl isomerase [Robiginitalea myxolifaciens]SFR49992.1 periplasmic chaperone for outer membrane proteins SurA [Robiginitalea myxolifaciens]